MNGVGSSATPSGNTLTLTLNMTFGWGFAGNRVFYLGARDVNELNNTGWQAMGSWTEQYGRAQKLRGKNLVRRSPHPPDYTAGRVL